MLIPDSIIMIKKLPYLPDILPSSSSAYNIYVEDFMVRDVFYIWYGMTYSELKQALKQGRKLKGFPLVDNPDHMVLLGSIKRSELIALIQKQGGNSIDILNLRWQLETSSILHSALHIKACLKTENNDVDRLWVIPKNVY